MTSPMQTFSSFARALKQFLDLEVRDYPWVSSARYSSAFWMDGKRFERYRRVRVEPAIWGPFSRTCRNDGAPRWLRTPWKRGERVRIGSSDLNVTEGVASPSTAISTRLWL